MKASFGLVIFLSLILVAGCAAQRHSPSYLDWTPRPARTLAVIGDTQHTVFAERFFMGREHNEAEQSVLMADLMAQRPDAVVHLGDLTGSASASAWNSFDELMAGVRAGDVPVLPVYGNHDYWRGRSRAEKEFGDRFPSTRSNHYYARRFGRFLLVVLDSNFGKFSHDEWETQRRWFGEQLDAADADETIAGVLVFTHHPPYTNSRVTSDDRHVQEAYAVPFAAHLKTMAMFCGHTHSYEHFQMNGKTFVVCGGGGGPRVHLRDGDARRHNDLFAGPSPRPLHYALLHDASDGVHVLIRGMNKGDSALHDVDEFVLGVPVLDSSRRQSR